MTVDPARPPHAAGSQQPQPAPPQEWSPQSVQPPTAPPPSWQPQSGPPQGVHPQSVPPQGMPPQGWDPQHQPWGAQPAPVGQPMVMVPLRPTGVTVMLVLESIATALLILLIVSIVALASSMGNPPPPEVGIAFSVFGAMMVLRCAALVLVRIGNAWARWMYIGVVAVGTFGVISFSPMPLVILLALLAVVTCVFLFIRRTSLWLQWKATSS